MLLKKIVVAEDDDAIAHMVSMTLGDAGFLCLRAQDGEEALRLVRTHDPDLLVLDVMMPRLDGHEVARRLKADVMWSRTPILMLTALASVENQVEGIEAGADAYLPKPFDLRELQAKVKALIRATRRERDRNPTTDLPGSRAIDDHLDALFKAHKPVTVLHVDAIGWDAYADNVGFARAEDAARAIGRLVLDEARAASDGSAFVGHLGGSDFIVVTAPSTGEALARRLVERSEALMTQLSELGGGAKAPVLVVAVAPTEGTRDSVEIGKRLGQAMKMAKAAGTPGFVVWAPPAA